MTFRTTRRNFLSTSLTAGLAMPLVATRQPARAPSRALEVLILGGTAFLGPATVEAARRRGHTVTLFNRGKTNPGMFPDLEKLQGDRDGKLDALHDRTFDAVVDTSAYVPRHVRLTADLLEDKVSHYVFVSTVSVYAGFGKGKDPVDEDSAVATIEDVETEKVDGETYGALKALCEQTAEAIMPGRVANLRPGLIVGPDDPTDRFTYWPARVARGGEVLAPGDPDAEVQFIDVRDLGEWIMHVIEHKVCGVFNAVGFPGRVTMQELLHACKCTLNTETTFTWPSEEFLAEQNVGPWMEMPLWIPRDGRSRAANDRAIAKGLTFRPISQTIADTAAWVKDQRGERKWRAGLKADKEATVLKAWHEHQAKR